MLDAIWPWMHLAARVIFAGSLMILSAGNFTSHENTASRTPPVPKGAMVASGIMVWAGAIMIASGWHRFIGSGLVILFLIPVSLRMHNYWSQTDSVARMVNRAQFWKNVGLAGAALFFATYSRFEWPMSLGHLNP
jgi:putative oxidoreductase